MQECVEINGQRWQFSISHYKNTGYIRVGFCHERIVTGYRLHNLVEVHCSYAVRLNAVQVSIYRGEWAPDIPPREFIRAAWTVIGVPVAEDEYPREPWFYGDKYTAAVKAVMLEWNAKHTVKKRDSQREPQPIDPSRD